MNLVAIVARDLIIATRIGEAARAAGRDVLRVDDPAALPPASDVSIAFVDWSIREPGWGTTLAAWRADTPEPASPRLIVFGSHTDLVAHADARAAHLDPMLARSKLVADLPSLFA